MRFGRRKEYALIEIYDELVSFGHTNIWLREINPPNPYKRLLISWDNNVLATYKPVLDRWFLCKKARLVNANPHGSVPPGPGLILFEDDSFPFNYSLKGY